MTSSTSQLGYWRSPPATTDSRPSKIVLLGLAAALLLALVASWPALGAGFQTDDFRWLWHARIHSGADLTRVFTETIGFYRPFTTLVWSFDVARAGHDPLAFSMTNLGLHLLALVLFAAVARRLLRTSAAAAAAVVLAALGYPYTNMAVIWLSGRGALLGAVAALAVLWLWDRWCAGRAGVCGYAAALMTLAVALGSYEAVAGLPILMAFLLYRRRPWSWMGGPLTLWVVYFGVRVAAGARQPWVPGGGYEYAISAVLPNLLEYTGRVVAAGAVIGLFLLAIAASGGALRAVFRSMSAAASDAAPVGLMWFLAGLLPALPVASRSNLYVYFAAFGAHLVVAAALAAGFTTLCVRRRRAAFVFAAALLAAIFGAWPFFAWDRNERFVAPAGLAMRAVGNMRRLVPTPAIGECLVLVDDSELSPRLFNAFSDHLPWVGAFVYGTAPSARIVYGGNLAAALDAGCREPVRLYLREGASGTAALQRESVERR